MNACSIYISQNFQEIHFAPRSKPGPLTAVLSKSGPVQKDILQILQLLLCLSAPLNEKKHRVRLENNPDTVSCEQEPHKGANQTKFERKNDTVIVRG